MKKLFVLSFDSTRIDPTKLHEAISTSKLVNNWSHFLPSSYIIQSESTAKELSQEIRKNQGDGFIHHIFRLDKNYYGFMPQKQWDWLHKRSDWWG